VYLEDTTYADTSAVLVRHEVVPAVPLPDGTIPFELKGVAADERSTYTVRVLVDRDGDGRISRGDYISTASYPVLTRGHPSEATVRTRRVGGMPGGARLKPDAA